MLNVCTRRINFQNVLVSVQYTKVTDVLADGRTPHGGIGLALCIASRGKAKLQYTNIIIRQPGNKEDADSRSC